MFTRELRRRAAARPGAKRASPRGAAGRRAASVERLEGRVLLAFAPLGPEARVNTTTAGDQSNVEIAADADGDFVLVWQSDGQDGSGLGVYARRYAASGAALGGEFLVNTTTAGHQFAPAVAMDADGDFAVAWQSTQLDGTGGDIYARRYDAAGTPLEAEFRISPENNSARDPALASDLFGNFVATWMGVDSKGASMFAERLGPVGGAPGPIRSLGQPFRDTKSSVAVEADGSYVVTWTGPDDFKTRDVYGERYSAADADLGFFHFNTSLVGDQSLPDVAAEPRGGFVVTWTSIPQDDSLQAIVARRYDSDGIALGEEMLVNTFTIGSQVDSSVACDADGDFVVTWTSADQDGSGKGVYARRYSGAGIPEPSEFLVNTTTTSDQARSAIAMDAAGDFVVAWDSSLQDGSSGGVYTQRFDEATDDAGPFVTGAFIADRALVPGGRVQAGVTRALLDLSERLSTTGGVTGSNSATNPANWRLSRDGVDTSSAIRSVAFAFNAATRKYEATLSLAPLLVAGNYVLTALASLRDPSLNALDGNLDGVPGGDYTLPFVVVNDPPVTVGIPSVSVAEDEEPFVVSLFDAFGDATDADAALAYAIVGNSNPALFSATPVDGAAGTLTLDSAPDASGTASITVRATDTGGRSVETTFLVTVLAVNDAPVNTVPGPQFGTPGQPLVFSVAGGNPISVADIDAGPRGVSVTLSTDSGFTFELARTTGVTFTNEGRTLHVSGSIANVNGALDGLRLVPGAGAGRSTSVTVTTSDTGTGLGGTLSDTDVIPVTFDATAIGVSVGDVTVAEGNNVTSVATFTVRLTREAPGATVHVSTADGTATDAENDYEPLDGVLTFGRGETQKTVSVLIDGDLDFEPDETFFLNLSDAKGGITITDAQAVGTITNDDAPGPPPAVTQVFVSGTTWKPAFKGYLAGLGLGSGAFGYAVPAGAGQLAVLPWGNINQVSVQFNKDVLVLDLDLAVRGVNVAGYPVIDFAYEEVSHTATWTLGRAVRNDKLLLVLDGSPEGITDAAGALLDGDWSNGGDAYPSGNSSPGGDFKFRLNMVAGDSNRGGRTDAVDWVDVRSRQRRSTTSVGSGASGYNVFADLDGSGGIDSMDLLHVRRNLLSVLPGAEPTGVLLPGAPSARGDYRRGLGMVL